MIYTLNTRTPTDPREPPYKYVHTLATAYTSFPGTFAWSYDRQTASLLYGSRAFLADGAAVLPLLTKRIAERPVWVVGSGHVPRVHALPGHARRYPHEPLLRLLLHRYLWLSVFSRGSPRESGPPGARSVDRACGSITGHFGDELRLSSHAWLLARKGGIHLGRYDHSSRDRLTSGRVLDRADTRVLGMGGTGQTSGGIGNRTERRILGVERLGLPLKIRTLRHISFSWGRGGGKKEKDTRGRRHEQASGMERRKAG